MYYITVGYFCVSALIYLFFLASPEEIGVKLEAEALVVAVENDDFKRVT
jgi:hypothetical protein